MWVIFDRHATPPPHTLPLQCIKKNMTDFFYGWGVARKGKQRVRVRESGEEGGAKKPYGPPTHPSKNS